MATVNFSGKWVLNKEKSDDPDMMLQAFGVNYAVRTALSYAGRSVEINHEGTNWTELATTTVITRCVALVNRPAVVARGPAAVRPPSSPAVAADRRRSCLPLSGRSPRRLF